MLRRAGPATVVSYSSSYSTKSGWPGCPDTPAPQWTGSSQGSQTQGASVFRIGPAVRWDSSRQGGATVGTRDRRMSVEEREDGLSERRVSEAEKVCQCCLAKCRVECQSATVALVMWDCQCQAATRLRTQSHTTDVLLLATYGDRKVRMSTTCPKSLHKRSHTIHCW